METIRIIIMLLDLLASILVQQSPVDYNPLSNMMYSKENTPLSNNCLLKERGNSCPNEVYVIIRLPSNLTFDRWLDTKTSAIYYWSESYTWTTDITMAKIYLFHGDAMEDLSIATNIIPDHLGRLDIKSTTAVVSLNEGVYMELMDR